MSEEFAKDYWKQLSGKIKDKWGSPVGRDKQSALRRIYRD
ncbi:MAG: hypothetical protein FD165_2044 [Gammaproteobacteria bacterium]|nr:MAG: hypothetical protein FD165_2044 [Gammaproteobacteria bacterium]